MWFKNIQVYRFTKPFQFSAEELDEKLAEQAFVPCGNQDMHRTGWVPPLGDPEGSYIHSANGYIMLTAKRQDKVLPAAVVNEFVQEKVEELQEQESRKIGRKERQEIKDEMIFTLLPRAFTRSSKLYAYIDLKAQLLIINAGSAKKAEDFCHVLRETLGTLPVVPITTNNIPQQVMTNWMKEGVHPEGFELGGECELRDTSDEGGVIRCKNQVLTAAEINNHVQESMYVSKIELASSNGIECIVDENLAIKRIRYGDMIQDKAEEVYTGDAAERFDVDFSIMTLELSALIQSLLGAFGGENLDAIEDEVIAA